MKDKSKNFVKREKGFFLKISVVYTNEWNREKSNIKGEFDYRKKVCIGHLNCLNKEIKTKKTEEMKYD